MIKIIKHGQKEFNCVCPWCGCEFTYEHEDIKTEIIGEVIGEITYSHGSTSYVVCPNCKYHCRVPGKTNWSPFIDDPLYMDRFNTPSEPSTCHECEWGKKMTQPGGFTYVGDTPCTWCSKNPYRTTCFNSISSNTANTLNKEELKGFAKESTKITYKNTDKTTAISSNAMPYNGNIGASNANSLTRDIAEE